MIVACSGANELAKKVAKLKNLEVMEVESYKFPDGEVYVRLPKQELPEDVIVMQNFYPNQNDKLVEFILACDSACDYGVKRIKAIFPYFAYARQDKRFKEGEAISIKAIAKILKEFNVKEIITIDVHFHRKEGEFDFFGVKGYNIAATDLLIDYVKRNYCKDFVTVAPDIGQAKALGKAEYFEKERISGDEIIMKKRDIDVEGKNVLVIDDMISTGGTMIEACKLVKKIGAKKIFAACTHGLFLRNSYEKLKEIVDDVIATDTIQSEASKVSVASLIAKYLCNTNNDL